MCDSKLASSKVNPVSQLDSFFTDRQIASCFHDIGNCYHGHLAIRGLKTLTKRFSHPFEIHVEFFGRKFGLYQLGKIINLE